MIMRNVRISSLITAFLLAACLVPAAASANVNGFEGADGDEACLSTAIDWSCLPLGAPLSSSSDATGSTDLVFGGGAKEETPSGWTFVSGGTGNKADLLTVKSTFQETDTASFLDLAFTRVATTGDVFLTFELNQVRTLWDAGNGNIPCRTDGDVLISYAGQNNVTPVLYRWTGSGGPAICPDGATGTWTLGTGPAATVEGYTSGTFGEAALDLGSVARNVGLTSPCEYFTSLQAHSRESSSISSSMADYVAPENISVPA